MADETDNVPAELPPPTPQQALLSAVLAAIPEGVVTGSQVAHGQMPATEGTGEAASVAVTTRTRWFRDRLSRL